MDVARLETIARQHGILLIVQFGSSVSGLFRPDSDIDLAVLAERAPDSLADQGQLVADLQPFYPGREVDLVLLNRADPLLLKKITERCALVYGPERRLHEPK